MWVKNQLIFYKRNLRNLESKQNYYETKLDSLYTYYHDIDSSHMADLLLKENLFISLNDSMNNELDVLAANIKLKNIEIADYQNQLDVLNQQIEIFTVKKTNIEEKEENLKSLAKTYEAMKLKDMASILKYSTYPFIPDE